MKPKILTVIAPPVFPSRLNTGSATNNATNVIAEAPTHTRLTVSSDDVEENCAVVAMIRAKWDPPTRIGIPSGDTATVRQFLVDSVEAASSTDGGELEVLVPIAIGMPNVRIRIAQQL
jgi:hypothetical protein